MTPAQNPLPSSDPISRIDRMEAQLDEISRKLTVLLEGDEKHDGIQVRLANLEGEAERRRWMQNTVLAAAVVVLAGGFFSGLIYLLQHPFGVQK